jgi:hypothetical protein
VVGGGATAPHPHANTNTTSDFVIYAPLQVGERGAAPIHGAVHCPSRYSSRAAIWMHDNDADLGDPAPGRSGVAVA